MTKINKLTFELPDSGVEVTVRGISSSSLAVDLVTQFPKPTPPVIEVVYGPDDIRLEPNEADPDYHKLVEDWQTDLELKRQRLLLTRGVLNKLDEDDRLDIAETRAWAQEEGLNLDKNDKIVWIKYIACATDKDFMALIKAISQLAEPDQEVVAQIQDGF